MALVNVTLDGGLTIEQMEETLLEKKTGSVENYNETTHWIEYWLDGKLVHRSVHVILKKGLDISGALGDIG